LSIYKSRVADLLRIATSGTGVLPAGALHPDLVNRLASEAAKSAQHVLNMCIRALDYCPPVGVNFGDYLRALVTADSDLVPYDDKGYRVAFIEAFRRRGIYPRDVRTLSVESLRWRGAIERGDNEYFEQIAEKLRSFVSKFNYFKDRREVFERAREIKGRLHEMIANELINAPRFEEITGLAFTPQCPLDDIKRGKGNKPVFEVHSLRPSRRIGPDGETLNQVIISITQQRNVPIDKDAPENGKKAARQEEVETFTFRGGCTLILDLNSLSLRYSIKKSINDDARLEQQREFRTGVDGASLRATYFGQLDQGTYDEPFALMHRGV
ncbi:MAG TPA: hypothetical protein VJT09_05535, partial [Pyrinomonadaceae bacterium]|nr:hypothetical protein [Pyrinomonadaceae bacterium]